jgi:peptide deformylase
VAILEIITRDNPRLRLKAKRVPKVDDSVRRLMDDMVETMLAAPGVGLAANQVDVQLRVIVMKVDNQLYTLANPEMVRSSGEQIGYEGCLSVPGYVGEVARAERVTIKALNRNGREVRIKGEGLLARAIQHEIDHLDGVLFVDRLTSLDTLRPVAVAGEDEAEGEIPEGETVTLAV